jgi:hypothetical protein
MILSKVAKIALTIVFKLKIFLHKIGLDLPRALWHGACKLFAELLVRRPVPPLARLAAVAHHLFQGIYVPR